MTIHLYDLADGLNQLIRTGIFEQIAQRAGFERRENLVVGRETGQDQDADLGLAQGDFANSLNAVYLGHNQVHQNHVRMQPFGLSDRLAAIAGFAHDGQPRFSGQKGANTAADNGMVVGDQDANGHNNLSESC